MADLPMILPLGEPLVLYASVSSLPPPVDYTAGVSLDTLKTGRVIPALAEGGRALPESGLLYIRSDMGAGVVVTIPGPVSVYAGRDGDWYPINPPLLGGADLMIEKWKGGSPARIFFGADWDRLLLVSTGAITGGTISADLVAEVRL